MQLLCGRPTCSSMFVDLCSNDELWDLPPPPSYPSSSTVFSVFIVDEYLPARPLTGARDRGHTGDPGPPCSQHTQPVVTCPRTHTETFPTPHPSTHTHTLTHIHYMVSLSLTHWCYGMLRIKLLMVHSDIAAIDLGWAWWCSGNVACIGPVI